MVKILTGTDRALKQLWGLCRCGMYDKRVEISVSGVIFETFLSTLEKFPDTLLGSELKRQPYYVREKNQYVFQRHHHAFDAILFYYQSNGKLLRPEDIPLKLFKEEAEFFEIDKNAVEDMLEKNGFVSEPQEVLPCNAVQRQIWQLFEFPSSSKAAKCVAIFSTAMVVAAVLSNIVQSLPSVKLQRQKYKRRMQDPCFLWDLVLNGWFLFELATRFVCSPIKRAFFKSFLNLVDFVAIVLFFLEFTIGNSKTNFMSFLRIVRIVRIFRIFKLSRYSKGLQIIGFCFRSSLNELGLLLLCLTIMAFALSSLMYYAELNDNSSSFTSVPAALWFAFQTLTTLGYGDIVPTSPLGKLIAGLSAVYGALTISLPVLSIVSNFNKIYYNNIDMKIKRKF